MSQHPLPHSPAGSPCLQGERVAFTGTLASMTHRDAGTLVEQHGGTAAEHVSRQTTMLVVGEEGWPLDDDGHESVKLRQVHDWQQQGLEIRVVSESDWLHLVGLDQRRSEVHRQYTPAMLSQLLDLPVHVIRGWERVGLIRPVRKVCRLPYFDFQEVAGARRLNDLFAAGVPQREIEASLLRLRKVFGDVERPLAQLEILARGRHVAVRDDRGLFDPSSGQRLIDFDPHETSPDNDEDDDPPTVSLPFGDADFQKHWSAGDWFQQGCKLLEEGETTEAIEAFRMALSEKPADPEINFHLAEALYRGGNVLGAVERYYAAVESDHEYIEAWTQLGCVYAELGKFDFALDALTIALEVHADYPDAHWHRAEVLHQLGRTGEAVSEWQSYLEHSRRGPWAETARQRLEAAGVGSGEW